MVLCMCETAAAWCTQSLLNGSVPHRLAQAGRHQPACRTAHSGDSLFPHAASLLHRLSPCRLACRLVLCVLRVSSSATRHIAHSSQPSLSLPLIHTQHSPVPAPASPSPPSSSAATPVTVRRRVTCTSPRALGWSGPAPGGSGSPSSVRVNHWCTSAPGWTRAGMTGI